MQSLNIGLSDEQRQGVIGILNANLADFYLLLIKTKKYHWDVVGPQFRSLHELWEEHYLALTQNIDDTAERMRALGGYPVGTAAGFLQLTSLREHPSDLPKAYEMVARLGQTTSKLFATFAGELRAARTLSAIAARRTSSPACWSNTKRWPGCCAPFLKVRVLAIAPTLPPLPPPSKTIILQQFLTLNPSPQRRRGALKRTSWLLSLRLCEEMILTNLAE